MMTIAQTNNQTDARRDVNALFLFFFLFLNCPRCLSRSNFRSSIKIAREQLATHSGRTVFSVDQVGRRVKRTKSETFLSGSV